MRRMTAAATRPAFGPCLEVLARNCDDAILVWDTAGTCRLANAAAERLTGRPERDLTGRALRDAVSAGDPLNLSPCVEATLRGETVPEVERELRRDGEVPVAVRVRCSTMRDGTGAIVGGVAVLRDFSPERRAEAACRVSERARSAVFDAALDAIVVVDADGRYADANPAACALLGRSREEILRHWVGDFGAPGWDGSLAYHDALSGGVRRRHHRIVRPDGTERDLEFEVRREFLPGLHLGDFRDVTEETAALAALRVSENRFRALFEGIPAPVVVFRRGPDGRLVVVEANRAAASVGGPRVRPGTGAEELLGHRPELISLLRAAGPDRPAAQEEFEWRSAADGRTLRLRGFVCFVAPDLIVAFAEDVTAQRAAESERSSLLDAERAARAAAERAEARYRRLARRVTEILESERATLARGLHDELGQELTALRMRLERAALPGADAPAIAAASADHATELLARVRDLSSALRPQMLDDLGLVAAVVWSARRFAAATGVEVDFEQHAADRRFLPEIELAAYRIVQEALTNVARHSGTAAARVRLWVRGADLFAEVADAGRGFDSEAGDEPGRAAGLAGMRERAELAGGTLAVESSPGRGTVVTAAFPDAVRESRA